MSEGVGKSVPVKRPKGWMPPQDTAYGHIGHTPGFSAGHGKGAAGRRQTGVSRQRRARRRARRAS